MSPTRARIFPAVRSPIPRGWVTVVPLAATAALISVVVVAMRRSRWRISATSSTAHRRSGWPGRSPRSPPVSSSAATSRIATRTIQVLPAPTNPLFSHVNQAWLIERYTTDPAGNPLSALAALGVTTLTADQAGAASLAALVGNHWGIESPHWLRDTVYREDHCTATTRSGPRAMPALRNLAVGAHHLLGRGDITEATRQPSRDMHRAFRTLKLTS
jgi:hypothetical protein